jgi:hypothetical protein
MRNYSAQVIEFLTKFLTPYATKWNLDFSRFPPLDEQRRDLPLPKRNDLPHLAAFPRRLKAETPAKDLKAFADAAPDRQPDAE